MRHIVEYYKGERQEAFITIGWGVMALAAAYYSCIEWQDVLGVGMSVPLAVIGGLHLLVGIYTALRTNRQIKAVLDDFSDKMQLFKFEEINRMEAVINEFNKFRLIAQVIFVVGVILVVLGVTDKVSKYWCGVGIGLFIQGAAILFLDLFAEMRAKEYYRMLSKK